MSSKTFSFNILILSLLLMPLIAAGRPAHPAVDHNKQHPSAAGSAPQPSTDVKGTWSGTFFSKHSNVVPFTMTVVINPDSRGHLIGSSTLSSDCLNGVQLEVTVTGSMVVLAGSDESGDNITVRGTVDKTGTLLKATYILNGSATGKCETDDGAGNMAKR
jgi:hypothetical protein